MNGQNRPLIKPKRRLVSFYIFLLDSSGSYLMSIQINMHETAHRPCTLNKHTKKIEQVNFPKIIYVYRMRIADYRYTGSIQTFDITF